MVSIRTSIQVTCKSKELLSFAGARELNSFDARHVTRSRPIENRISVGMYINTFYAYISYINHIIGLFTKVTSKLNSSGLT